MLALSNEQRTGCLPIVACVFTKIRKNLFCVGFVRQESCAIGLVEVSLAVVPVIVVHALHI